MQLFVTSLLVHHWKKKTKSKRKNQKKQKKNVTKSMIAFDMTYIFELFRNSVLLFPYGNVGHT